MPLIDVAGAGELCTTRTNVDVTLPVEDKVGSAEGAIVACGLVPHRNMRRDLAIHQPLEQPDRAIDTIACEPLGPKIEAAFGTVYHGLGDGDFHCTVGARALGIDNDPDLVVDEIVRIVGRRPLAQVFVIACLTLRPRRQGSPCSPYRSPL